VGLEYLPISVQRIRYPPFEHHHMLPNELPIAELAIESEFQPTPVFSIGDEKDWFVEWREFNEDEDSGLIKLASEVKIDPPLFIKRSRLGWYIDPDPLHNISRKFIPTTVAVLIFVLFIHAIAIENQLVEIGILPSVFSGSFRIGPLEYPRLLFIAFPLFLLPIAIRTVANFKDMSKQSNFISKPVNAPEIEVVADGHGVSVIINGLPDDVVPIRARIQAGIIIPERSAVIKSLGRREGGQPSPGMSTQLPEKRIAAVDKDGTGVGEVTPMQRTNSRVMILEPMRMMDSGPWEDVQEETPIQLMGPNWPGSIYSPLIAVHWELILQFNVKSKGKLYWVRPITIDQSQDPLNIEKAPVRSGRAEMSNY